VTTAIEPHSWRERFAPHLGLPTVESPYFKELGGGIDPVVQLELIADLGFPGVFDLRLATRPPEEQARMAQTIERRGLAFGGVSLTEQRNLPLLTSSDPEMRGVLRAEVQRGGEALRRVGGRMLVAHTPRNPDLPAAVEREHMVETLRWAGDIAAGLGVVIALETVSDRVFPGRLLNDVHDAFAIAEAVDMPSVGLSFDTGSIKFESDDIVGAFREVASRVACVQIGDRPGADLGAHGYDLVEFLRTVRACGFEGLIELEHRVDGREAELEALERLQTIDRRL
jgi:sugar phosphate isomerase/epimerase